MRPPNSDGETGAVERWLLATIFMKHVLQSSDASGGAKQWWWWWGGGVPEKRVQGRAVRQGPQDGAPGQCKAAQPSGVSSVRAGSCQCRVPGAPQLHVFSVRGRGGSRGRSRRMRRAPAAWRDGTCRELRMAAGAKLPLHFFLGAACSTRWQFRRYVALCTCCATAVQTHASGQQDGAVQRWPCSGTAAVHPPSSWESPSSWSPSAQRARRRGAINKEPWTACRAPTPPTCSPRPPPAHNPSLVYPSCRLLTVFLTLGAAACGKGKKDGGQRSQGNGRRAGQPAVRGRSQADPRLLQPAAPACLLGLGCGGLLLGSGRGLLGCGLQGESRGV